MCITAVPQEERENGEEMFKLIMAKTFSKLMIDAKLQIQEAQRIPNKIYTHTHTKKFYTKHTIVKLQKTKDRENLERIQRKKIPYL